MSSKINNTSNNNNTFNFCENQKYKKGIRINNKILLSQLNSVEILINKKRKIKECFNNWKNKENKSLTKREILNNLIKHKNNINNKNNFINSVITIVLLRVKKDTFEFMINISKLNIIEKIYNKIIIKSFKKQFLEKLKFIKSSYNDIVFLKIKNSIERYSDSKDKNENNNIGIKRVKTNIKRYRTNNIDLDDNKEDDISCFKFKNNLLKYSSNIIEKDDDNKDIVIKRVKTNIQKYSTNNIIRFSDDEESQNQSKITEEDEIINNINTEKKNETLSKLFNIKNNSLNNLIKQYFKKWNQFCLVKMNTIKKKKRIAKRHNFKKKRIPKNEIITISSKISNNKELLRSIIYRWKNNANKVKIIDDYKHILNKMKKNKINYEEITDQNHMNKSNKTPGINLDLLNKLKKVSLHLLLSIYQKSRDKYKMQYFNQWKTIVTLNKLKKKNRALVKQISKYIKKKVGGCFKKKENNDIIKKNKEKTFAKKKTKLNLYKERFTQYKNSFQPKYNNLTNTKTNNNINNLITDTYAIEKPYIPNKNEPENNKINGDNYILNILSNYNEPNYIIKKPGKRNLSLNRNKIKNILDENSIEDNGNRKYISKSGEKYYPINKKYNNINNLNSYVENLLTNTEFSSEYPYNNTYMENSEDKKINMNLSKTLSSQEESTKNHISLVEESNEIQKPKNSINLSIKNKKNYFSPDKTYKISHPNNYFLTENRTNKYTYPKNSLNYNERMLSNSTYNNKNNYPIYNNNNYLNPQLTERIPKHNNIYLYSNEEDDFNARDYYINKPQYYQSSTFNDNIYNNNYNSKTINPLYERMKKTKMNSQINSYNSPFSRKVLKDQNKIKIIYNQNNDPYNFSESEEYYNNESNYGIDTIRNNYNINNIFY